MASRSFNANAQSFNSSLSNESHNSTRDQIEEDPDLTDGDQSELVHNDQLQMQRKSRFFCHFAISKKSRQLATVFCLPFEFDHLRFDEIFYVMSKP